MVAGSLFFFGFVYRICCPVDTKRITLPVSATEDNMEATATTTRNIGMDGVGMPYFYEAEMVEIRSDEDPLYVAYLPTVVIAIVVDGATYTLKGFAAVDHDQREAHAQAHEMVAKVLRRGVVNLQHWAREATYEERATDGTEEAEAMDEARGW